MQERRRIVIIISSLFVVLTIVLTFCYFSFLNLNGNFSEVEKSHEMKNKITNLKYKITNFHNQLITNSNPAKIDLQNLNSLDTDITALIDLIMNKNNSYQLKTAQDLQLAKTNYYDITERIINNTIIDSIYIYRLSYSRSSIILKLDILEVNQNDVLTEKQLKVARTLQYTTWVAIICFIITFFVLIVALNRLLSNADDKQNQIRILEKINHQKNSFFSVIGHDLKNPLGSFITLTEVLESNSDSLKKEDFTLYINMMKKSANNIFKLLDNLLQWSRLQMNYINFTPVNIEINKVIKNVIHQFELSLSEKDLEIKTDFENENIIEGDIWIIENVLKNIVSNAIKYSFRGAIINIITRKQKDKLHIIVEDFGIGMDEARLKNIFNLDKREPLAGTEKETGTGLGLLISKELIEKSGEKLWSTAELGKGSKFTITAKYIS